MRVWTKILMVCLLLPGVAGAQDWAGLSVSSYSGMHAGLNNPAMLGVMRNRLQVGVFGANGQISTNLLATRGGGLGRLFDGFSLSRQGFDELKNGNLGLGFADIFSDAKWQRVESGDNKDFTATAEIRGPFVAVAVGPLAFGLGYRLRGGFQLRNVSPTVADLFFSGARRANPLQVGLTLSDASFSASTNAYHEIYGTVAFPIFSVGQHALSGGITLKYLAGMYSASVRSDGLQYKVLGPDSIVTLKADASYQYVDNTNLDNGLFSPSGFGAGFDIGLVYELRGLNEADLPYGAGKGAHLFRAGASVLDVGQISFSGSGVRSYDFRRVNAQNVWGSIDTLQLGGTASLDTALSKVFGTRNRANSFTTGLPAVVNVFADLKVFKQFYVAATTTQSLTAVARGGMRGFSSFTVMPRYESKWVEVALPIGFGLGNRYLQPGFFARVSGFYVGSDNLASIFGASNRAGLSFYAGGYVPLGR